MKLIEGGVFILMNGVLLWSLLFVPLSWMEITLITLIGMLSLYIALLRISEDRDESAIGKVLSGG